MPGEYLVQAEPTGFQKFAQTVTLEIGSAARLDFSLAVGVDRRDGHRRRRHAAAQHRIGDARHRRRQTTRWRSCRWRSATGTTCSRWCPACRATATPSRAAARRSAAPAASTCTAPAALQNNFLLDGVDNNSISENVQELTTQVSRPSVDAIQEFKVVTSPYSAEYGRSPGAAISVTTKSGTNALPRHGLRLLPQRLVRRERLLLEARRRSRSPPTTRTSSAATSAGRSSKDRAFFFADYEGTRITRGVTAHRRACRRPTSAAASSPPPIRDPLTGQPFPNNTIPAEPHRSRTPPPILAPGAAPNQPGANNFFRAADSTDDSDRVLGRARPARRASNDNVFARYIYSNRQRNIPGAFGGVLDGTGDLGLRQPDDQDQRRRAAAGRASSARRIVNELRVSWSQATSDAVQQPFGQPADRRRRHSRARSPTRLVAGGLPGHHDRRLLRRLGPRPHRLARLPAEVPAHEPVRVHRHAVVAARATTRSSSAPTSSCR